MAQSISQEAIGATGLPGATAASRHAGATVSGAPTTGTFAVGDFIVDQSGAMYVCTVAGTPGTWQLSGVSVNENIAGKNFVINGGFDIWQRGTSFSSTTSVTYTADRWGYSTAVTAGTYTISQIASGLTGFKYANRVQRTSGSTQTGSFYFGNSIETLNSLPMAGQTVTLSFWARAGANYSPTSSYLTPNVYSGTGTDLNILNGSFTGLASVASQLCVLTTSWQKFTLTGTVGSTATQLALQFVETPTGTAGANDYFDITGVQLEIAPQATPFSRAGGSIGGELALCYRYYYRTTAYNQTTGSTYVYSQLSTANVASSAGQIYLQPMVPVAMRTNPTALDYNLSNIGAFAGGVSRIAITSISIASGSQFFPGVVLNSSTNSFTQGQTYVLQDQGSGNGYLGISAEL